MARDLTRPPIRDRNLHLYHVTSAQLAVYRKAEPGPVSQPLVQIEPEPNGPYLLLLQRPFRTELPSSVKWLSPGARIKFRLSHRCSPAANMATRRTMPDSGVKWPQADWQVSNSTGGKPPFTQSLALALRNTIALLEFLHDAAALMRALARWKPSSVR